jgi:hypothetical protein
VEIGCAIIEKIYFFVRIIALANGYKVNCFNCLTVKRSIILMKNVKSFLFVTLLSLSGLALADACCSANEEGNVVCGVEGYTSEKPCTKKVITKEVDAEGCEVLNIDDEEAEEDTDVKE